jgi:hypothetical protein
MCGEFGDDCGFLCSAKPANRTSSKRKQADVALDPTANLFFTSQPLKSTEIPPSVVTDTAEDETAAEGAGAEKKVKVEKKHKCKRTDCERSFNKPCELEWHVDFKHLRTYNNVCDHIIDKENGTMCDFKCETPSGLAQHKKYKHTDIGEKCEYDGCERSFRRDDELKQHVDFAHLRKYNNVCDLLKENGTKCEYKCEQPGNLKIHKKFKHSDVRPFKCSVCPDTFKTAPARDKHFASVCSDPEDPVRTQHRCKACNGGFPTATYRDNHYLRKCAAKDDPRRIAFMIRDNAAARKRYANDENIRLRASVRAGLRRLMETMGLTKDTESEKLLGCSYEELIIHLNTNDRGLIYNMDGPVLHIDHIRPISNFNIGCRLELLEACNWNNLQLLLGTENVQKGASFTLEQSELYYKSVGGMAIVELRKVWRVSEMCTCENCVCE